ncbi:recombination protein RecR [Candidatus Beckwithbacteria bacterium CG10_big_fil_rev_8_21_14_0_10_34_10]|uniref:Recombination protein RecR n=1 Tax=Candidatus Beckwithbacteria bacterium CG10_big_fil_rev_8_21_14_0_10_34_10 TaxID=1974495 RepID=A0A2H0W946_9BACT|nr:MAG: recombination protein RecR [Candidatus Beckwithbacteria bacterium CG10_big_fil_rev_8_21_14_0_10_34_10]
MKIARAIRDLVESFEKLPGIGPKTAQRMTFYLLHVPQKDLESFSKSLINLKKNTKICSLCFNISETDPCPICSDPSRDKGKICLLEQPLDILAIEKGCFYKGVYHVLGGVIDPLNNIGPEELHIYDLLPRLKSGKINELIIATNPTIEGEATAMYILNLVKKYKDLKISRIGRGLPTGAALEYADELTLSKSFEGRREY